MANNFEQRWYARKYGLTVEEVSRLLACPSLHQIEQKLDTWRGMVGWPAANSPLSRDMLLDLLSKAEEKDK